MSKEFKIELFNIYDIVVFEDENGITQDCVCIIGKDKEVDKIVDKVECNNHCISIYENGSYKVWEQDGKNKPYYVTNKKIIHLYTLKNDNRFYEIYPTNDYETAIDNANPSEALNKLEELKECIQDEIAYYYKGYVCCKEEVHKYDKDFKIIEQALLKAQEPKQYLKWEDLEFKNEGQIMKVILNGSKYKLGYFTDGITEYVDLLTDENFNLIGRYVDSNSYEKQFFNDLHLERVE